MFVTFLVIIRRSYEVSMRVHQFGSHLNEERGLVDSLDVLLLEYVSLGLSIFWPHILLCCLRKTCRLLRQVYATELCGNCRF